MTEEPTHKQLHEGIEKNRAEIEVVRNTVGIAPTGCPPLITQVTRIDERLTNIARLVWLIAGAAVAGTVGVWLEAMGIVAGP